VIKIDVNENMKFIFDDNDTGLTLLDFWKFRYCNIFDLQESIAEFIVAKALGKETADNLEYWTLYDIDYRGKRVEVKETSYYHPWNKDGKVSMQRTFGITKANSSYGDKTHENRYERQNDVYVFCLNTGFTAEESYPLNLNNWEFYIVPTKVINEKCENQKTVSLQRIKQLGFEAKRYDEIRQTIDSFIETGEV
jgi:hypothetical protein